jgi:hypothetical protein
VSVHNDGNQLLLIFAKRLSFSFTKTGRAAINALQ